MVYKERLKAAMDDRSVHPKTLADHLDVTLQTVRKVLAGKSAAFNVPNHFEAARYLKVDPGWLATGEGDKHSGLTWPFGSDVTPAQFSAIDKVSIQNATDILQAAARRLPARTSSADLTEQYSQRKKVKHAA